jgi:hypothetical protein
MKILFISLTLLVLNTDCKQNKTSDVSNIKVNSENSSKMMQDYSTISYEASTRGFYEKIWVTKDSITVTKDRNQMSSMSYPTPEKDWNELTTLLKEVDIEEMPNLEAPTTMRHSDGAAFATLAVGEGENEIKSSSFDHGHPPKAIEPVVNKVLSMKKIYEKK